MFDGVCEWTSVRVRSRPLCYKLWSMQATDEWSFNTTESWDVRPWHHSIYIDSDPRLF